MSRTSQHIAQKLTDAVHKTLKKDLSKGKVNLPEDGNQHELPLINKSKVSKTDQKQQAQLHTIVKKRKKLEQELQQIKYDEQVAKQKRPHPMQEIQEGKTRYFRSTISPEEKEKIKKVIEETKKFEHAATMKNIALLQKIKKEDEEKREARKQQIKQLHEKRRKQAEQKLKQLQTRKLERNKQILSANREFQKVSKLKFLHQAIQEKWRAIEQEEKERNQKLIEKLKQKKKFNIGQIKEHARRYSQIAIINEEKRQKQSQELRMTLLEQSRLARHSYSTFFKTINEQQSVQKQTLTQKMNLNRILHNKKTMYAETIKQKHKFSIKKQSSPKSDLKTVNDIRSSRSLDNLALNKLGNQYMKQIHSCIDTAPITHQSPKPQTQQHFKYEDYLTKARKSRHEKNPEDEPLQMTELRSIIKKKTDDKETRLYKAKALVGRMDQKAGSSSKNLINSIMAKLSLIQQFGQPQ